MDARELLATRASCSKLVDPGPSAAELDEILAGAMRAPDHGALRPWRFYVIEGDARAALGEVLAQALAAREPGVTEEQLERERRKPMRSPLLIAVAAVPVASPKAPEIEQVLSAGTAAHAILLGLHARGYGGVWKTGDAAYDPRVKRALGLRDEDHIVAVIYAGTPEKPPAEADRPRPPALVVRWRG